MVIKKKVGFFYEKPENEVRAEILAERCIQDPPDEDKIVAYLDQGHILFVGAMIQFDCASDERTEIGPLRILTDGVFAWTSDLSYYVEKYHYLLPAEFIEHMRGNSWRCPQVSDLSSYRIEGLV